ncbi:hypothetical protein [Halodurantibacterium flavum]|uniref:Glyceraldehyde-3-phosphate dehydrogenase n=1 Tax=Halodurantibacterium flavum TaxID=1382802 RepID=A0ABW4S3X0_9RHOB
MSDRIALGVGSLAIVAIAADLILGTGGVMFALRWIDSFVEYLAFWR